MAVLGFARQRGLGRLVAGNELALPFASAAFDCVVAVHGKAAARDDFFARPRWLNELLRLEIVWEARLRLNRLAPFGVALLAVARRPGPERS
jgi:hypothetical protein